MKPINFIKTLSPAQQHALTRWYHLSVTLICLLFITIVICQTVQLCTHLRLKKDAYYWLPKQASLHQVLDKKNDLLQKINGAENELSTLKKLSADDRLPHLLDTYVHALNKTVLLQSLTIRSTQVLCTIVCNKPINAFKFVAALNSSGLFASVKVTQLKTYNQHQTPMIQATITADLLKP